MDTRMPPTGRAANREDSNIIWFAEECLNNGVRLDNYVRAAERRGDSQLTEFFQRALAASRNVEGGDPRLGRLRHAARLTEYGLPG